MDPNIKFTCGYKPVEEEKQGASMSCGNMFFIGIILATFAVICIAKGAMFMLLLLLAAVVLTVMSMMKSNLSQFLRVTPLALQVVRSDGSILKEYALKNIRAAYASDPDTVKIMLWSEQAQASVEHTLRFVSNPDGLAEAITKYGRIRSAAPQLIPEVPQQIPVQPYPLPVFQRDLTEDEADELHAAQHLLNQGMISPHQYSGMLVPPVPERAPVPVKQEDVNTVNAEDYLRRQEMIAQQLGTAPETAQNEEQLYGQRSDF